MPDFPGTLKHSIITANEAHNAPQTPRGAREPIIRRKRARPRHMIVRALYQAGWKVNEIAAEMGYTASAISIILNSRHPELVAQDEKSRKRVEANVEDLMLRFRMEAKKSLDALIFVRDQDEDVAQKRMAARDILDRAGYGVVKKSINLNTSVPADQLAEVVDRIGEAHNVDEDDRWAVKNPSQLEQQLAAKESEKSRF